MAPGYNIYLNGVRIRTAEALYQACRFPNNPELQRSIINQISPMTAKNISRKYEHLTRTDWMQKRVAIMNWCIHIKLLYNWGKMGYLFDLTENKDIVELSSKDDFWGAYVHNNIAEGYNVLGKLLMSLRKDYYSNINREFIVLGIPDVDNFIFLGKSVNELRIDVTKKYNLYDNYSLFDDYHFR